MRTIVLYSFAVRSRGKFSRPALVVWRYAVLVSMVRDTHDIKPSSLQPTLIILVLATFLLKLLPLLTPFDRPHFRLASLFGSLLASIFHVKRNISSFLTSIESEFFQILERNRWRERYCSWSPNTSRDYSRVEPAFTLSSDKQQP